MNSLNFSGLRVQKIYPKMHIQDKFKPLKTKRVCFI
jgi:hypothetical protein